MIESDLAIYYFAQGAVSGATGATYERASKWEPTDDDDIN